MVRTVTSVTERHSVMHLEHLTNVELILIVRSYFQSCILSEFVTLLTLWIVLFVALCKFVDNSAFENTAMPSVMLGFGFD